MDRKVKLFEIAERQQGFFTSQQAEQCGFSRSNFRYKIQSGEWINQARGIYRLANYPITDQQELILWTLWTRDKKGRPQGVLSHDTALEIHELSDVMSSKLHFSVPVHFRKGIAIPKNLQLHFAMLESSEIEERQGYRVTNPLRTLIDVIQEETISDEHISAALREALKRGLITIEEIQKIASWARSIGKMQIDEMISNITADLWKEAENILANLGRIVEPYTIGLAFGENGGPPFGTAILIEYKSNFFLLTACHVGRQFETAKVVRLILRFDDKRREYPPRRTKDFVLKEWDKEFDEASLSSKELIFSNIPKDLAIIMPPPELLSILKEFKSFYKAIELPEFDKRDALISYGGIEAVFFDDTKTYLLKIGPWAVVAEEHKQFQDVDYVICPVSNNTYAIRALGEKAIASFAGLSGGGLWKYSSGKLTLVGVAIAQDVEGYNPKTRMRNLYFHGPRSMFAAFNDLIK